jgi:hypothetical protein
MSKTNQFKKIKGENQMNTFYHLLLNETASQEPYHKALINLTRATHDQLKALKSDLAWQQWSEAEMA